MTSLTTKEQETVKKYLEAFNNNFKPITIEKQGKTFYIFQEEPNWLNHNWIYSTDNINNLNGWLYGAIQAKNSIIK